MLLNLEKAKKWLRSQRARRNSNGMPAGPADDKNYIYTEITGYYLKAMLLSGDIEEANAAASYLLDLENDGYMPWNGNPEAPSFVFDSLIVADSLLDMFDYTFQDRYYNTAYRIANTAESVIDSGPYAIYQDGKAWNDLRTYYTLPGAHFIKLIPILKRFNLSTKQVEKLIPILQRGDGAFHCHPKTRYVFTHFHCYALDGIQDENKYAREYRRGVLWLHKAMNMMEHRPELKPRLPAWSSDKSWTMPGANIQAAYHLNRHGLYEDARLLRETASEDQLEDGSIPTKNGGEAEAWPTIFSILYS